MQKISFSILDYCAFISLLLCSAFIGVFFWIRDRNKVTNKEYLTGGRSLSVFPVSMSLAASFMSTNTLLGVPAEIFILGTQFHVCVLITLIAVLLAAHVFMPIYYDLELTSVSKYLLKRFNANSVRLLGSIGFILCTLPYMGVVLFGPSLALSSVTPLSIPTSILVVGTLCTFYTAVGGIKAVVWTDVIQCFLMIFGLLMVVVSGLYEFGLVEPFRITKATNRLIIANTQFDIYRGDTIWTVFFGIFITWLSGFCVQQTQVQRYCCLESKQKALSALYWCLPGILSIPLLALWCGIFMVAKYHACDPVQMNILDRYDQLMPYYVIETLGKYPGISGIFVACIFSGSLSTLSSGFNSMATVVWDDFIKHLFRNTSEKTAVAVNKFVAASFGLLSIGMAFVMGRLGTVMQASVTMSGAVTGPLFGLFCLGIFTPCVNAKGAFVGLITGIALCLTIAFGSLANQRPEIRLPSGTNCSAETLAYYGLQSTKANYILPGHYHPKGLNKLFHVSHYLVPFIGFATSMALGVLVSLCTGGNKHVPPHLISPLAKKLFGRKSKSEPEQDKLNDLNAGLYVSYNNQKDIMRPVVDEVKRRLDKGVDSDNPLASKRTKNTNVNNRPNDILTTDV